MAVCLAYQVTALVADPFGIIAIPRFVPPAAHVLTSVFSATELTEYGTSLTSGSIVPRLAAS